MWMKEETMGVEDCFRLTQSVLQCFFVFLESRSIDKIRLLSRVIFAQLLGLWVKDLSVRDLCDRIDISLQEY